MLSPQAFGLVLSITVDVFDRAIVVFSDNWVEDINIVGVDNFRFLRNMALPITAINSHQYRRSIRRSILPHYYADACLSYDKKVHFMLNLGSSSVIVLVKIGVFLFHLLGVLAAPALY